MRPGRHRRCCPRRPAARHRRPVPSHWRPPNSARRPRRRARPDRGVPAPAGSRRTPPCSGRAARAPGTGGDRCRGCPARIRPRGNRRPPVPVRPRRDRSARALPPDSAITVSSLMLHAGVSGVFGGVAATLVERLADQLNRFRAKSPFASSRRRAVRDRAARRRPVPSSPAPVRRRRGVGIELGHGLEKLKSAGLNLRVISQKLRALRGHCVTTRPLAARK